MRLRGDVILTFVVGELQGGVGTLAAINEGVRADYFINSEPTDLAAVTMHAASLSYTIELTRRHSASVKARGCSGRHLRCMRSHSSHQRDDLPGRQERGASLHQSWSRGHPPRRPEDMGIRNLAENTQQSCLQQVSLFAGHFHRSPEALGPEKVRAYQLHLTKTRKRR